MADASTRASFAALLAGNPLFAGLATAMVDKIAALGIVRRLEANAVLFSKGDVGDGLYAVRRGQLNIMIGTADGRQMTLATLGSGDVFGEIALLDGQPRTADAVATQACELFLVRRRDFLALLAADPEFALAVIEMLCARLRSANERMEEAVLMPLDVRLARRLAALAEDFGATLDVSQEQLAEMVGSTRETVNRQLQVWRRDGTIQLSRSRITILDLDRLKADGL